MAVESRTRQRFVYQVRADRLKQPLDIVTELTHAVWRALEESDGVAALDTHRWPTLYLDFRDVFKSRLSRYDGCGERPECARGLNAVYAAPPGAVPAPPATYTLSIDREMGGFLRALAALAVHRFRDVLPAPPAERRRLRDDLAGVIRRALAEYLYYSDRCQVCEVRQGVQERRLWK